MVIENLVPFNIDISVVAIKMYHVLFLQINSSILVYNDQFLEQLDAEEQTGNADTERWVRRVIFSSF